MLDDNIKNYLKCTNLLNNFFKKLKYCNNCPGDKNCGCCKTNVFGFYKKVNKNVSQEGYDFFFISGAVSIISGLSFFIYSTTKYYKMKNKKFLKKEKKSK